MPGSVIGAGSVAPTRMCAGNDAIQIADRVVIGSMMMPRLLRLSDLRDEGGRPIKGGGGGRPIKNVYFSNTRFGNSNVVSVFVCRIYVLSRL